MATSQHNSADNLNDQLNRSKFLSHCILKIKKPQNDMVTGISVSFAYQSVVEGLFLSLCSHHLKSKDTLQKVRQKTFLP